MRQQQTIRNKADNDPKQPRIYLSAAEVASANLVSLYTVKKKMSEQDRTDIFLQIVIDNCSAILEARFQVLRY